MNHLKRLLLLGPIYFSAAVYPGLAVAAAEVERHSGVVPGTTSTQIGPHGIWAAAIAIILAAAGGWIAARRLARRQARRIHQTALLWHQGDLSARITVTDPRSPMGTIGQLLNVLAGELQRQLNEGRIQAESLQQRLSARISDLSEAQNRLQVEIAERAKADSGLQRAHKMQVVGQLASGIAHDFNNVLGIIQGFAMERRRLDAPGASRSEDALALGRALQGIETAARRGASISRKLLKFSRNDVTRAETFDAAKSLRDLQPLLRQMLPPGARLGIEAPDAPLWVEFDRSQFELALLNLASNACDAMPRGGELAMSIAAVGTDQVLITVSDDGEGMPDEVRQRIFEPFYTTKPADAGTGLGLTVVYALVDRFGGRIEVDSAPGRGTTFRILLPVAAAPGEGAHASTGGPNQPVRVMLVEDDDDLLGLLKSALERGGCDVQATASGREAARLVGEDDFRPQVLVCDSGLRDMDGTTLLASLRTQLPDAPIILISASLDSDAAPADADPRTERLPKPFPPDELVTRVWQAARRHAAAPLSRAPGRTPRHAPH